MTCLVCLFFTIFAKPFQYHVLEVSLKAVFLRQRPLDLMKNIFRAFHGLAAFGADKVMMMTFFCMMVDKVVAGFALEYTPSVLQNIKRPVNGRLVHARHLTLNVIDYIFRCKMRSIFMNDIRDQPALRC